MRLTLRLAAALLAAAVTAPLPAAAAQFWLAGRDPVDQSVKGGGPTDYMDLFAPGAAWTQAESRLSVFKVSAQFILRSSDDTLRAVVGSLHQHHVAFAVEMGAVLRSAECGGGEGFAPPGLIDRVAGRLQRLGLGLDVWAMDEPLWFGHVKSWGRNECTYPVDVVAQRVAANVASMRQHFPAVRIGDIEVVAAERIDPRQLLADYAAFTEDFERLTGQKLAFFHFDVAWRGQGARLVAPLNRELRGLGVRTGIIFGGGLQDPSDEAWVAHGLQTMQDVESDPATRPDDVIVQSWQDLPSRMLPETQPGSYTYMLREAEALAR